MADENNNIYKKRIKCLSSSNNLANITEDMKISENILENASSQ